MKKLTLAAGFGVALVASLLLMFAISTIVDRLTGSGGAVMQTAKAPAPTAPAATPAEKETAASQPAPSAPAEPPQQKAEAPAPTPAPAAAPVSLGALLAAADAAKGAKVAKKCVACHSFDKGGKNKVGPNLYGIVGHKIAAHEGFKYSPAMKAFGESHGTWSYELLARYLKKPKKVVPKTKMAFGGIKKDKQLANLLVWMGQQADSPLPLPSP